MKKIFQSSLLALNLASMALLSACGGGSDTSNTTPEQAVVQPAWGSPAMFVPQGSSQVAIAVSGCSDGGGSVPRQFSEMDTPQRGSSTSINSPSLVITAAGDVIFSGALGTATTATELVRLNFANTTDRRIDFNSVAERNALYVANDSTELNLGAERGNPTLSASNATYSINCSTVANLTPAYAPSEARLAAKFTTGATSWANDSVLPFATTTIANNLITWNNQASNTTLDSTQTSARYASLNVASGALNVGPSASQVTQSVAISAASAAGGSYTEQDYADTDFSQGRAKSVNLSIITANQGELKFYAYTGDNIMIVKPSLGTPIVIRPVLPGAPF